MGYYHLYVLKSYNDDLELTLGVIQLGSDLPACVLCLGDPGQFSNISVFCKMGTS